MTPFTASMFHLFRRFAAAFLFAMLVLSTACTSTPASPTKVTPTATSLAPLATLQPQPLSPTTVPDTAVTLTLWLPTRFLPAKDNAAYQVMQRQLDEFARTTAGTPSQITIKQDHGPGGLLDLLRTASPVAPSVLPDIIALDNVDLETAVRLGLLQPIGPLLPAELINDLYPFAHDLGSFNGELYGVVYSADLEQLASGSTPLPQTWKDLLAAPRRYFFALGSSNNISDAVLEHYLSAGGRLADEQGNPVLDEIPLRTLLETYQDARKAGVLPGNFVELTNADEVWNEWRGFGTAVANLNTTRYLTVEQRLPDLQAGDLPALIQPARSIGRGWAYAIVTKDPRRQAAAVRLLAHLLSPQNSGEWTRAAGALPGRAAALAQWDQANSYTALTSDQLVRARPLPPAAIRNAVSPVLLKAIEDVLTDRATPGEAARAAIIALNSTSK